MASRSSSTISDARRNAAPYPPPGTTRGANVAQSAARSGASASQANARPTFSYKTWEGGKMDEVDVTLTTDAEEVQKVLSKMSGPLGFDLEWEFEMGPDNKAQTHYPTALAQVCDETHVLLVHLAKMDSFPDALKELVEDRNRIKIGVGIAGDARKLKNDFELNARAMLDLNVLGRKYIPKYFGPGFNGKDFLRSLKTLTGTYLKCDLPKEMSIRAGQWAGELNEQQIEYAVNDVYASLGIYHQILQSRSARNTSTRELIDLANGPPFDPYHEEDLKRQRKAAEEAAKAQASE